MYLAKQMVFILVDLIKLGHSFSLKWKKNRWH